MRKDFYVQCRDTADAEKIIEKIGPVAGDRWADPITHPFRETRLLPWNLDVLAAHEELIEGKPRLSFDQAMKGGFDIGFHRGKFSQAERKIEEARLTLALLPVALKAANFPAVRALFYAVQSSLYSTREAIKKTCDRISPDAKLWGRSTAGDIRRNEPFVEMLNVDYNRDKHSEASGLLIPNLKLYSYQGRRPDFISGEACFRWRVMIPSGNIGCFIQGRSAK